jgi:hypothetical protein
VRIGLHHRALTGWWKRFLWWEKRLKVADFRHSGASSQMIGCELGTHKKIVPGLEAFNASQKC